MYDLIFTCIPQYLGVVYLGPTPQAEAPISIMYKQLVVIKKKLLILSSHFFVVSWNILLDEKTYSELSD